MSLSDIPHRRLNALTGEWILVSPHRTKRPWQGKVEAAATGTRPQYDPKCYLCPGNERAGGVHNPKYENTFVFENDFAALLPDVPSESVDEGGLFVAQSERGECRVICFSPRHDLTLSLMDHSSVEKIVNIWAEQYSQLGALAHVNYVQIFENRGDIMGCSNPHPHGQIWSNERLPYLPWLEQENQKAYRSRTGSCLLCDYLKAELDKKERLVWENDQFAVLVPYWAVWPFEVMVLPKRHCADIAQSDGALREGLADAMIALGIRYDNLFQTSFPYSMGIHQRPTDAEEHPEWHFHLHYYPPLLRSATVKKFMVGYEMLAMPQRDITPEESARRLRECSEVHYTRVVNG